MNKITLMLMVFVMSLMVTSAAFAKTDSVTTKQATMTIEKVYYAKGSGYYLAHTTKDKEGHFWVLQVTEIAAQKEDESFTQVLRKQYQGNQVIVTYVEPIDSDEEVEIWSVKLK
ncbi:hypothetical protein [Paenibacillus sp. 1781tsa1]|uniref:hypothetical protein n=1 Tax=Paenibacillus sp. 1781tsa1 TaxID=2953810 RepID=UPI00209ECAFA|nr:hypothetical protein [Paenibacillus sp. 1781tsa1]MCP1185068.1 hypothetical protein [Paenibacillus sp. 1781tsa1]